MTETVHDTITTLREEFHSRMASFEEQLKKTSNTAAPTLAGLSSEYSTFKTFVLKTLELLQTQVDTLARNADNVEMRSRRKILLLHGVSEAKDEVVEQAVVKVIQSQLHLDDFTADDIRRCHRMGRQSGDSKPRPILCKFERMSVRDKTWTSKTKLKGSGITISEFLTRTRHTVFMAARQKFGISSCWTRDGFIFVVGPDGTRHRIASLAEVNGLEVDSPKPSANTAKVATRTRRIVAPKK